MRLTTRPLEGGGQVRDDSTGYRALGWGRISGSVRSRPQRDDLLPGSVSIEYRPRGGGADGEGGGGDGSPLFQRVTGNGILGGNRNTPTARPLPRPPPAPSRGGGQSVAIVRIAVHGERERISVWVIASNRGSAHPGRGTVSIEYRSHGGMEHPLPCLLRFIENPSPWNTPASPISPQRRLAKRCTAVPPPGIRPWRGSLNPGCGREPGKPLLKKDQ